MGGNYERSNHSYYVQQPMDIKCIEVNKVKRAIVILGFSNQT